MTSTPNATPVRTECTRDVSLEGVAARFVLKLLLKQVLDEHNRLLRVTALAIEALWVRK